MISPPILRFLFCSGLCFLSLAGGAQTLFNDNLEGGAGNWSVYSYPGAPVCTPLTYVSTATDPNANHTPGGAFGFKMTRAMEIVGGQGFYRGFGLERLFRDVQAAKYHPLPEPDQQRFLGESILGQGPPGELAQMVQVKWERVAG